MQKFNLILSVALFAAIGFTSCEPKPVVEPPYNGKYAEYCLANYNGKQQNKYVYYITLSEKGVMTQDGVIIAEGNLLHLQIMCSEENKEGNYYLPLEGTYSIEEKNAKMSIDYYSYVEEWGDYDIQTTKISIGDITIKKINNGYRIDVKYYRDGEEYNIRYEGVLKTHNYTEPTDASLTEFTVNDLQYLYNYGNYSGIDYVLFYAKNNEANPVHCYLQFFASTGATSLPTGIYTIKSLNSYEANKVINWNPILFKYNDEGYISWVYYANEGGTVTVTSNGFTVNMTSRTNNRAITITYTGDLTYMDWQN